eukprot:g10347.t1
MDKAKASPAAAGKADASGEAAETGDATDEGSAEESTTISPAAASDIIRMSAALGLDTEQAKQLNATLQLIDPEHYDDVLDVLTAIHKSASTTTTSTAVSDEEIEQAAYGLGIKEEDIAQIHATLSNIKPELNHEILHTVEDLKASTKQIGATGTGKAIQGFQGFEAEASADARELYRETQGHDPQGFYLKVSLPVEKVVSQMSNEGSSCGSLVATSIDQNGELRLPSKGSQDLFLLAGMFGSKYSDSYEGAQVNLKISQLVFHEIREGGDVVEYSICGRGSLTWKALNVKGSLGDSVKLCGGGVPAEDDAIQSNCFAVPESSEMYQAIVRLDCVQGQEYAGHLVLNQKDAEKSAAEQAIIAFSQSELLEQQTAADKDPKDSSYSRTLGQENGLCCALNSLNLQLEDKKKKKPTKLTPEEHAQRKAKQEEEGNPAVTPKTLLNALVMKIIKRYLQKGETVYETKTYAGGGHQDRAEQSAAEMALESIKQDAELMKESEKPKGMGKGEKAVQAKACSHFLEDAFGWIKPDVTIDHKDAGRREGKIFVGKSDVPEALKMAAGYDGSWSSRFASTVTNSGARLVASRLKESLCLRALWMFDAQMMRLGLDRMSPPFKIVHQYIMRNQAGLGGVCIWETRDEAQLSMIRVLWNSLPVTPRVSSVCKLVPRFFRVYFDVLLTNAPPECIEKVVPLLLQRFASLYPVDFFLNSVHTLIIDTLQALKLLMALFRHGLIDSLCLRLYSNSGRSSSCHCRGRHELSRFGLGVPPSFCDPLRQVVHAISTHLDVQGRLLVLHLCWIIGELLRPPCEADGRAGLAMFFEALETLAYQAISVIAQPALHGSGGAEVDGALNKSGGKGLERVHRFAAVGL